jgi:hypothetical protein
MKRTLLDKLLREVEQITGERELVMIGSQTVLAAVADVPAEVVMSRECDLLFDERDRITDMIDASLGPDSERAAEHLVHVDTVSSTFPFLARAGNSALCPSARWRRTYDASKSTTSCCPSSRRVASRTTN